MIYKPIQYHDYLQLDRILNSQSLRSEEEGKPAHEEMLFIIVHQAYEIWFKQMLHELDSVLRAFSQPKVAENHMGVVVSRLERFTEIQKLIEKQIDVLETMSPMEFLDFRDLLYPASGFQSLQFRLIENKLGLKSEQRLTYNKAPYHEHFTKDQSKELLRTESQPSLFDYIEKWLERTPFLNFGDFNFLEAYHKSVTAMFEREKDLIERNQRLDEEMKNKALENVKTSITTFDALLDEKKYNQMRSEGRWRFSYKAIHPALFIQLYREQPALTLPFRVLTSLLDIDELMTQWRYRHALMAKRMLGTKVGTGGSSGAEYLKQSAEKHKLFTDLFQLTTFFIPRSELPPLPRKIREQMSFFYQI